MEEEYNTKRDYDFRKGEDPFERYAGRHVHPERGRREQSRLQNLLSETRGRDLVDVVDPEDLETRKDDESQYDLKEENIRYIRKIL